jgi:hypothetical protein
MSDVVSHRQHVEPGAAVEVDELRQRELSVAPGRVGVQLEEQGLGHPPQLRRKLHRSGRRLWIHTAPQPGRYAHARACGAATLGRVIVSLHVATGAVGGAIVGSRRGSLPLGLLLHLAGDRLPHQDIGDRRFEIGSGIAAVLLLALVRGPLDPAVTGALAASSPDLEHVVRLPRPSGRKLFPSHRFRGWHRAGGVSARAQLLVAGFLIGSVLRPRVDPP